jgi:hypothetical protein
MVRELRKDLVVAGWLFPWRPASGAAGVLLLVVAGCGPTWTSAEVEGKVLLGNQPLESARVTFYPDVAESEHLPSASGMTDGSGAFTLTLENGRAGAVVGRNRAVVRYPQPARNPNGPPPPGPPIPLRYTVAETALVVEVKEGRQVINLNLASE